MKKSVQNILMAAALLNIGEFSGPLIEDPAVLDCIMSMYFYMLCEEEEKKEEFFQKFDEQYKKLNEAQQKQVQEDYLSIIEAQDKNQEVPHQKEKSDDKKGQ